MGPWSDPKSEFSGIESPDPDPRESQKSLLGAVIYGTMHYHSTPSLLMVSKMEIIGLNLLVFYSLASLPSSISVEMISQSCILDHQFTISGTTSGILVYLEQQAKLL